MLFRCFKIRFRSFAVASLFSFFTPLVTNAATAVTIRMEVASNAAAGTRTLRVLRGDAASNPVLFTKGTIPDYTTQSFSIVGRGITSKITDEQPGAPIVGYARIELAAGSPTPAGLAIFDNRSGGVLLSEAAVPAGLIQYGRVHFFGYGGPTSTGIAIVNPSDQRVRITFTITSANPPNSFDLAARSQIARFLNEPPFLDAVTGSREGTFTFAASSPVAVIALRGYVNERGRWIRDSAGSVPGRVADLDNRSFRNLPDWLTRALQRTGRLFNLHSGTCERS
ncbi:MAG: hypothetical protein DMG13_06995 [Acidobacteria bacterium]|nr:MAG: hypothetical protein DMG13_06995 [Acidobacteriota bacterium]